MFNMRFGIVVGLLCLTVATSGCAGTKKLRMMNDRQSEIICALSDEVNRLNSEVDDLSKSHEYLEKTKSLLQQRLKDELQKGDLTVDVNEKGIVVSVLNKILFDSGKITLKDGALQALEKVGSVLKTEALNQIIFVEGHTDNVPIRHSGYKSNWELSVLRATEVVHYFVDNLQLNPERITAVGHGEFQPVASNDSASSRAMNRRVEIIISPKTFIKKPFDSNIY